MNTPADKVYAIQMLTDDLIYIKWYTTPDIVQAEQFVTELGAVIEQFTHNMYILSDLRKGAIREVRIIQKLAYLARKPFVAGTTGFSGNPVTTMFVEVFERFTRRPKPENEVWNTPEEAIAYLESLKPGLTAGVNWQAVINGSIEIDQTHL